MPERSAKAELRTADVVVVGAGVLGAAVAHRLATHGLQVVVLERTGPASGGTGASAANVHVQGLHVRRPGQGVPLDAQRMLRLQVAARAGWDAWQSELDGEVALTACGGLTVAETPEQVEDLHTKHAWEQAVGLRTEVLDAQAAHQALPLLGPTVAGATWCALDGFADPVATTNALLAAAGRHGAAVVVGATTTRLQPPEHTGGTWRVTAATARGSSFSLTTPHVVDAAGPWLAQVASLAGVELAMNPVAIQMHRVGPTRTRLRHLVQHVAEGFSAKQDARDGTVVLGGGWPAAPWRAHETVVADPASAVGNRAQLARLLPALGRLPLVSTHPGPLAATPDEMPVVGSLPTAPGLVVVGGTYGFTFAPLWADVVTATVLGTHPEVDVTDLSPARLLIPTDSRPGGHRVDAL